MLLISTLGLLGQVEDAEWEVEEILASMPDFSVIEEEARVRFVRPEDRGNYVDGLRKAGFPD